MDTHATSEALDNNAKDIKVLMLSIGLVLLIPLGWLYIMLMVGDKPESTYQEAPETEQQDTNTEETETTDAETGYLGDIQLPFEGYRLVIA